MIYACKKLSCETTQWPAAFLAKALETDTLHEFLCWVDCFLTSSGFCSIVRSLACIDLMFSKACDLLNSLI